MHNEPPIQPHHLRPDAPPVPAAVASLQSTMNGVLWAVNSPAGRAILTRAYGPTPYPLTTPSQGGTHYDKGLDL